MTAHVTSSAHMRQCSDITCKHTHAHTVALSHTCMHSGYPSEIMGGTYHEGDKHGSICPGVCSAITLIRCPNWILLKVSARTCASLLFKILKITIIKKWWDTGQDDKKQAAECVKLDWLQVSQELFFFSNGAVATVVDRKFISTVLFLWNLGHLNDTGMCQQLHMNYTCWGF